MFECEGEAFDPSLVTGLQLIKASPWGSSQNWVRVYVDDRIVELGGKFGDHWTYEEATSIYRALLRAVTDSAAMARPVE